MVDCLLNKCIEKYQKMLSTCEGIEGCPPPSESLVIYHVKGSKRGSVYKKGKRLEAWRFAEGKVYSIPTEAQPAVMSGREMFTLEAFAEFGICRFSSHAFIDFYFGNGAGMGFEYDIAVSGNAFMIGNEQVLWQE